MDGSPLPLQSGSLTPSCLFQLRGNYMSDLKDDISGRIKDILEQKWDIATSKSVPEAQEVALKDGGVRLDATILYADLANSSKLVTELKATVAAKIIRAYLGCMTRLITYFGGEVRSFDGDRVMG